MMGSGLRTAVCPHCRSAVRIHEAEFVGREFRCPACRQGLRLSNGKLIAVSPSQVRTISSIVKQLTFPAAVISGLAIIFAVVAFVPSPVEIKRVENSSELVRRAESFDLNPNRSDKSDVVSDDIELDVDGWKIPDNRPAQKTPMSLLPPAVVEIPRTNSTKSSGNSNGQSRKSSLADDVSKRANRPIDVLVVPWDRESEPLAVVIEGGLAARSEERLSRQIIEFRTARPTQLSVVMETLAELAGVQIAIDGRWPIAEVTASFNQTSIDHMIRELLSDHECESRIDADGRLVVQGSVAQATRR